MATPDKTESGLYYPLTKMNFIVSLSGEGSGTAAFSEVTGVDASVDVIEFRQGNAHSLAPVKIQGLVKHGNITLKMGYTRDATFKEWIIKCVSEQRGETPRTSMYIELVDIQKGAPTTLETNATSTGDAITWVLTGAWVAKYTGPDLNASASEVAMESVEIAYEELTIPGISGGGGGGGGGEA